MIARDGSTSQSTSYIVRRIRSFEHALRGVRHMIATQPHARLHMSAVALVIIAGWILAIDASDWMILALACGLVLAMEAVNTAMEHLCDVVCPTWNENVRKTKDVAAGAVLISAITAVVIGSLVFAKYVLRSG